MIAHVNTRHLFAEKFSLMAACGLMLSALSPAHADVMINNAGPITQIGMTTDGKTYGKYYLDTKPFFYTATDSSTSAAIWTLYDVNSNTMYGPSNVSGVNSARAITRVGWTAVSQTGPTGTGTDSDPFLIQTIVKNTAANLQATLSIRYVSGARNYLSDYTVQNLGSSPRNLRTFFGADLYFADSNNGYPIYDPGTGGVGNYNWLPNGTQGTRTMMIYPITPADAYTLSMWTGANSVWVQINNHALQNLIETIADNTTAGLQWNFTLPAFGSKTVRMDTVFTDAPPPPPAPASYLRTPTYATGTDVVDARTGNSGTAINAYFAPELNDAGQPGSVFVFAYLPETVTLAPNTTWFFDSARNWHLFTGCQLTPAYFTGDLDIIQLFPVVSESTDLSSYKGAELYIGYGLGGYAQPSAQGCNDMFARHNWKKVYTVQ